VGAEFVGGAVRTIGIGTLAMFAPGLLCRGSINAPGIWFDPGL
jgi:hypothetical protein